MQVTVEAGEGLERRMTVQVPEERIASEVRTRLNSMRRTVKLHGFRPGKVPQKVLERTYGSQVRNEVVSSVLQSTLLEAFGQENINPAGRPSIDTLDADPGQGLSYTAVFEVYPKMAAPDLGAVRLKRPVAEVTEQDVDSMVETLRRQRRTWEVVEREAALGDQLLMDYKATVDGKDLEGIGATQIPLELGSKVLIEGFEEGLIGVKAGEERVLNLQFPEKYHGEELAGKPAQFTVKVHTVKEPRIPDIDDEFLKSYGVEDGGEEALRQEIRANMERELADAIRARLKQEVKDALLAANDVDIPKALIGEESERLMEQTQRSLVAQRAATPDIKLEPSMFEEQARRRVELGLIFAEIIKANDMHADPEKVRERIDVIASTYQEPSEVVSWYYADKQRLAEVESLVMEDEVVDWVASQALVEEEPSTFDAITKPGQTSA